MPAYRDSFGARADLREQQQQDGAQRGRERAVRAYSSIKCGLGNHAPAGCQSGGSGCLCTCHDAPTP